MEGYWDGFLQLFTFLHFLGFLNAGEKHGNGKGKKTQTHTNTGILVF